MVVGKIARISYRLYQYAKPTALLDVHFRINHLLDSFALCSPSPETGPSTPVTSDARLGVYSPWDIIRESQCTPGMGLVVARGGCESFGNMASGGLKLGRRHGLFLCAVTGSFSLGYVS